MSPFWIAAIIGISLAVALNLTMAAESGPFVIQGKTRFWAPAEVPKLRMILGAETVVPNIDGVLQVWDFAPAGSPGGINALVLARQIQGRGNVVTTSTNLYDAKAHRMMAEVAASELLSLDTSAKLASGVSLAVLPAV